MENIENNNENIKDDIAPPLAFQQINYTSPNIQNISNKDEKHINIYSPFSNISPNLQNINNNMTNIGFNIPQNQNRSIYPQMQLNPLNNPYQYNNMIYLNRLNYLNYINRINKANINNINSIQPTKNNLMINISELLLKKLEKKELIDLIQFIKKYCELTINEGCSQYKHDIFKVKKQKRRINEYMLYIKNEELIFSRKQNENKEDVKEHGKEDGNNEYYCSFHNMKFMDSRSYYVHCKSSHKYQCDECGKFFEKLRYYKFHECINKNKINNLNNINNENSNNIINSQKINNDNNNINNNMIKCTDCDLIFNNVENMTIHYHEIHEKALKENESKNKNNIDKKNIEEIKKRKEMKRQEELKKKEELKRQEELKKQEELKRQEEMKRQEELKRQEEMKRQEELKRKEELKR